MNKKQYKEYMKRYDKFKNCNLPYHFYDKERKTSEYVYYDKEQPIIENNLYESFNNIIYNNFYYPFTSGYIESYLKGEEVISSYKVGHNHAHSIDEVLSWLYQYPESFNISKDEEEFYSKQELDYIKELQKYLLFIGLKDCQEDKVSKKRYQNKKQAKYANSFHRIVKKELLDKIISGERTYVIRTTEFPDIYKDELSYKDKESTELLMDEDYNIKLFIEFIKYEKKQYKDIKNKHIIENLKDNDYVLIYHFKILERY